MPLVTRAKAKETDVAADERKKKSKKKTTAEVRQGLTVYLIFFDDVRMSDLPTM